MEAASAGAQRLDRVLLAVLSLAAVALYTLWCAPGIQIYDTAELATAAFQLGVSHPPGQPTWSMAGKLVQLVPLGSVAFRTNLLSAVAAGLSVWLTGLLSRQWARMVGQGADADRAAVLAATALAASGPLVNQATRTEVYTPAFTLTLGALLLVSRAIAEAEAPVRRLTAAGVLAGLAATLHPANGLGVGIVGLGAVGLMRPSALRAARPWAFTIAGLVAGTLPLAFVALRCRPGVEPCWEAHMDALGFWHYVSGAAFRHNLQHGTSALVAIRAALAFAVESSGWAAPVLVAIGIAAGSLSGRARALVSLTLALLVPFTFLAVSRFHPENPDTQGYMLPALAALFAATPVCALSLARRIGRPFALVLALVAVGLAVARGGAAAFRRSRYYLPEDMSVHALAETLPKAFVLAGSDHLFFALQYDQLVAGERPDVGVMVVGLATTSRHWIDVARRRPEIDLGHLHAPAAGERHAALAQAAMAQLHGVLPRYLENPLLLPAPVRSTGILFGVDVPQDRTAAAPRSIVREFTRRRAEYRDGMDRVIRLWRQKRAYEREDHGEIEGAVAEVMAGLWEDRIALGHALAGFSPERPLQPLLTTPRLSETWLADAASLRATLAQLLDRGGRTDLAMTVLARDFRAGNPEALLTLAELHLRDGRPAEAARVYDAFREAYPEHAGYAFVGLARVRVADHDLHGALRLLDRIDPGSDEDLAHYRDEVRRRVALLR